MEALADEHAIATVAGTGGGGQDPHGGVVPTGECAPRDRDPPRRGSSELVVGEQRREVDARRGDRGARLVDDLREGGPVPAAEVARGPLLGDEVLNVGEPRVQRPPDLAVQAAGNAEMKDPAANRQEERDDERRREGEPDPDRQPVQHPPSRRIR